MELDIYEQISSPISIFLTHNLVRLGMIIFCGFFNWGIFGYLGILR